VWTVDAEGDMERFLAWGVDALISNRPDLAATVRDTFVGTVTAAPART
jgi:glycerophosphoryl diester phosphodiesterase